VLRSLIRGLNRQVKRHSVSLRKTPCPCLVAEVKKPVLPVKGARNKEESHKDASWY